MGLDKRVSSFLAKLPPQVNGFALGLGGLGILWRDITTIYKYDFTWNTPVKWYGHLSHAFAYWCHTVVLLILITYAIKAAVHRNMFIGELRSFPKSAALATGPMALATVCTSMVRLVPVIAQTLWIIAFILHVVCTAFYLEGVYKYCREEQMEPGALRRRISDWSSFASSPRSRKDPTWKPSKGQEKVTPWNPAAFPPTVGVAAMASCATRIDFPQAAAVSLSMGVAWAVPVLVVVLCNAAVTRGLEVKEARTAIICAPFALCTAASWTVRNAFAKEEGDNEVIGSLFHGVFQSLYLMSIILYVVFLAYVPFLWYHKAIRAPGSAAFTFPTVIFATAMVRSDPFDPIFGKQATRIMAWTAAFIATLVVFGVALQFVIFLRRCAKKDAGAKESPEKSPSNDAVVVGSSISSGDVDGLEAHSETKAGVGKANGSADGDDLEKPNIFRRAASPFSNDGDGIGKGIFRRTVTPSNDDDLEKPPSFFQRAVSPLTPALAPSFLRQVSPKLLENDGNAPISPIGNGKRDKIVSL